MDSFMFSIKGKFMNKIIIIINLLIFVSCVLAQSGGNYQIVQSVTGNGGETSSGGNFSINGTSGQIITEQSSQGQYSVNSGFWTSNFAPTAASASISGRVLTFEGRGLRNAEISLTDSQGLTRSTRTSAFGAYSFDGIEPGQIVVIVVNSKRYQYQPQIVSVNENLSSIDFMPINRK